MVQYPQINQHDTPHKQNEELKSWLSWGAWIAQLVRHPTIDFSSGHELTVREFQPHVGLCADSVESAWDSLSLCPSPSFSLKINKLYQKNHNYLNR